MGPVDPELLQLRIKSMRNPQERTLAESIINAAFACLKRIQSLDFSALERDRAGGPTRALWTAAEAPVAEVWHAVEELQHAAKPLVDEHDSRISAEEEITFDVSIEGEAASTAAPKAPPVAATTQTPIDRIGETMWATSFVLNSEIDGFRRRLPSLIKVPDAWELLSDVQDHVGHIKAALQAILTGIYGSLYPNEGGARADVVSHDEQNIELLASRELRQRIFALRDDLLGVEASLATVPSSEWQALLRRAVTSLDSFMFGPGFAWMRASDKRSFIKQHRAISEILELWSPLRATPARRAVQNLARYLEALEVINQRECLVLHDRAALTVVVEKLEKANGAAQAERREHIAAGLAALADAQGRDKALDQLLEATLAPGSSVPTTEILQRAKTLLARLQH